MRRFNFLFPLIFPEIQHASFLRARRMRAVRRRDMDVASANTPHVKNKGVSLVTIFAPAKKVTRSRSE
jgi:hypothetical protein